MYRQACHRLSRGWFSSVGYLYSPKVYVTVKALFILESRVGTPAQSHEQRKVHWRPLKTLPLAFSVILCKHAKTHNPAAQLDLIDRRTLPN